MLTISGSFQICIDVGLECCGTNTSQGVTQCQLSPALRAAVGKRCHDANFAAIWAPQIPRHQSPETPAGAPRTG